MNESSSAGELVDPETFEELDHTADIAIRVRGATPTQLLLHAARGMMSIITGETPEGSPDTERRIELNSGGLDALLRDWLSELIFLVDADRLVPVDFLIDHADTKRLRARVRCVHLSPAIARNATEIKAVTWHGLSVREDDSGYVAEVVFDT